MIELSVRDTCTGRMLAQIVVDIGLGLGTLNPMSSATERPVRMDAPLLVPIAGRIDASGAEFFAAVDEWAAYLRSLGKRESSIRAFAQVVRAAILTQHWRRPEDATWKAVTEYMAAKRANEEWKGSTYNRNLSAFRSFSRWWSDRSNQPDPLRSVRRADDDSGDGARASNLEEARQLIAYARRRQGDARSKGNRALYWLMLFAVGCRGEEPARWRWKHLHLDGDAPWIDWTREIQKSKKHQPTGISPRVAALLQAHKHTVPHAPDDRVFPIVPPRQTFRADRDGCGIAALDDRGRPYSPHSARKGFSTILTAQGVPEKMVDRLMRHSGRVEHRYYDPSIEEQVRAASQMPELWGVTENLDGISKKGVAESVGMPYIGASDDGKPMAQTPYNSVRLAGVCGPTAFVADVPLGETPACPADLQGFSQTGNADYRLNKPGHNDPVSGVLLALVAVPATDRRALLLKLAALFATVALAAAAWRFISSPHTAKPERVEAEVRRYGP